MIKLQLLIGVVWFAIWVFTIIDVLSAPEPAIRRLPKLGWLIVVVVFGVIGTLAWFVLGRPEKAGPRTLTKHERATPAFPEYDRPGRAAAADPEKDDEFLRQVRERAEEQRRRYEQSKKEQPPAEEPPAAT